MFSRIQSFFSLCLLPRSKTWWNYEEDDKSYFSELREFSKSQVVALSAVMCRSLNKQVLWVSNRSGGPIMTRKNNAEIFGVSKHLTQSLWGSILIEIKVKKEKDSEIFSFFSLWFSNT